MPVTTSFETYLGNAMTDDTGTRKDGTIINNNFWVGFGQQLDGWIKSSTNPTSLPNETTDEVVEARGDYADLAARLDAIADPSTGVPVAATFLSYLLKTDAALQLGAENLAPNDDYLLWPNGDSAIPSYVTLFGGTPPTIARCGSGLADTNTKIGPYCMSLVFGSNPCGYYRTIISTTAAALLSHMKGSQKFAAGIWVKCATANAVRVYIDDGAAVTYSSYHTGDGTWQFLTIAPTTWSGGATQLLFGLRMEAAATAYVSGDTIVASDIAISRHIPCPTEIVKLVDHGIAGAVTTGTPKKIVTTPYPCIIVDTELSIVTVPTGQALIVDLDWLDFSGGGAPSLQVPYSTKPQIAAAAGTGRAAPDGTYQYRCLQPNWNGGKKGGGLSLNVDQVGSGAAGSDLSIAVVVMRYKRPTWLARYGAATDGY